MNSFLKKFVIGEWNLGISNQNFIAEFAKINEGGTLVLNITWMKHKRYHSFFADPFIYSVDTSNACVLAEEYLYSRKKGIISMCCIDRKTGVLLNRIEVLEESCHLSYPFYDNVSKVMIPESCRLNRWSSYQYKNDGVKIDKTISHLPLIDATPISWQGEEYVFASLLPNALSELYVYHFDNDQKLIPLQNNPVKVDLSSARCGGKFFEYDGRLFRIAQDSTHRYGEAIHIMEVTRLTPNEFSERHYCDVELLSDGKYPMGCHTLNFEDDFIVVDGFREKFRPFLATYMYKIAPLLRRYKLIK